MNVKLLGSAAAECIPALWCECETCQYARLHGGKDLRRRTSYLIDDDILVDYGPDIFWQVTQFNIDLRKVRRIFFTHSHCDHLNLVDLCWRMDGYSQVSQLIDMYGDQAVIDRILRSQLYGDVQGALPEALKFRYHLLQPGDVVQEEDLQVFALKANHAPAEIPLLYLLTRNGKTLFIANDTGYFPEQTWELLKGRHIEAMIIDCTGCIHPTYGHNMNCHSGAFTNVKIRQQLIDMGCMSEKAPVVINHFSHNGHSLHADMV